MELLLQLGQSKPDNNDVILQDLVSNRNFKQALNNAEKRLRKNKTNKLLVNRALILLATPDPEKQQQGKARIAELVQNGNLIADIAFLRVVDAANAYCNGLLKAEVDDMWSRATRASRDNDEVVVEWLHRNVATEDYKAAQKTALVRMNRIKKYGTLFEAITLCHLAATIPSPESMSQDQELCATMAYRLVSKAAKDTVEYLKHARAQQAASSTSELHVGLPNDPNLRGFQKPSDIGLYVDIMTSQRRHSEALQLLYPEGEKSVILEACQGSLAPAVLVMQLLEACEQWERLLDLTRNLLTDASTASGLSKGPRLSLGEMGDDWQVWQAYAKAARELQDLGAFNGDLAEAYRQQNWRGVLMAELEFLLPQRKGQPEGAAIALLLKFCERFKNETWQMQGIQKYFGLLSRPGQLHFIREASSSLHDFEEEPGSGLSFEEEPGSGLSVEDQARWISGEVSALELDYRLVVAKTENSSNKALLEAFVGNCLRLYRLSLLVDRPPGGITERRCGDNAAMLAAMACVHLHEGGNSYLVRAILILEELLVDSPHNFSGQLMLIRLYCFLGAITKAHEHYVRLDVKNIQSVSHSWILFQRISTIHPKKVGKHPFEPLRALETHLRWAVKAEESLPKGSISYLKQGQYPHLIDHANMRARLARSSSLFHMGAELWNLTSDRDKAANSERMLLGNQLRQGIVDTRDLKGFPNCEPSGQDTLEQLLRTGPWPEGSWCTLQSRKLALHHLISGTNNPLAAQTLEDWATELQTHGDPFFIRQGPHEASRLWPDLTEAERRSFLVLQAIFVGFRKTWRAVTKGKKWSAGVTRALRVAQLNGLDVDWTAKFAANPEAHWRHHRWELFHTLHVGIDTAHYVVAWLCVMCELYQDADAERWERVEGELVQSMELLASMKANIRAGAEKLRARFRAPLAGRDMYAEAAQGDNEVARQMREVFGTWRLQKRCNELVDSLGHTVDSLLEAVDDGFRVSVVER